MNSKGPQQTHKVVITSVRRRCDVNRRYYDVVCVYMTSQRRRNDVISRVYAGAMKPHNLITAYVIKYIWMYPTVSKILLANSECCNQTVRWGLRYPYMPRRHSFPWSVSYRSTCIYMYSPLGYTFSWKISVSLLMTERCSLMLNFVMLSRFHCQGWLNTCLLDIGTSKFQNKTCTE